MMKQKEVFNKIGGIIKELNEQYQYLQTTPEDLNDLELELFVANTHFLADHAEVLRKINKQATATKPAEEKPASYEEIHFEPVIRQAEPEPEIIKHELEIDESCVNEDEEIEEEQLTSPENEINGPESETEEVIAPKIEENNEPETSTIIKDLEPVATAPVKEVDEVFTINQKISAQMGKKPDAGLMPITDLKLAITLNDKLLFVKDLFNGYSLAYSEAIEILNRFKAFDEADTFLKKNYVTKNNWEGKPDTTAKFYEFLKRRYM